MQQFEAVAPQMKKFTSLANSCGEPRLWDKFQKLVVTSPI